VAAGQPLLEHLLEVAQLEEVVLRLLLYGRGAGDGRDRVLQVGGRIGGAAHLAGVAVLVLGVALTPQRSIAVDTRYIPLGCPVFISTKNPATKEEINRLVFAQDRGGAIKGTIRADYFWGFGKKAEDFAGIMKELGSLWVLLPKSVTDRTE